MKNLYLEVSPILPNGNLTTLRMCSSSVGSSTTRQDSYIWLPLITSYPTFDFSLTSNGLLNEVQISYGDISFNVSHVFQNEEWSTYDFTGALARIWWGEAGEDFSTYKQIFEGAVSALSREAHTATLTLLGTEADIVTNLLYDAYEGIGGPEGPASLKGTLKPWCSGFCQNISPLLVDPVYWVYQVHGYGPIQDIPTVYEFGQALSDPVATVSSYAELIALDLTEAQWAKAPAIGMFRLGGQPSQKLTCDVEGAKDGSTYPTTVSAIVQHLIKTAAPTAQFGDLSAFNNTSWCFYATSQVSLGDIARQAAYQAGGYLFPDGLGVWQIGDYFAPKPSGILSTEGDAEPIVLSIKELTTGGPVYKVRVGHDRCWSTHSDSEISGAILEIGENADALAADAEAARAAAEQAQADLAIARTRLDAMAADGILDRSEKKYWTGQYSTLSGEKNELLGEATGFADVEAEKSELITAWANLDSYLGALDPAWNNMTQDTAIDRTAFKAAWDAVYVARWQLNASMSVKAADRAVWDFVTDPNGTKPEDNATVGAPAGTMVANVPAETLVSDIEYLMLNGGRPPSVLAPVLQQKIDLLAIRATEMGAGNYVAISDLRNYAEGQFEQEEIQRTSLQAQINDNYAEFTEENAARISQTEAVADSVTLLTTRVGDAEGLITIEAQARTDDISSVVSLHDTLKARVETAEATIVDDRDASVQRDEAITTTTDGIVSRLNNVNGSGQTLEARVTSLNQAITDESGARSTAINQAVSDINGQISGVTQTLSSTTDRVGNVENKWSVTMDANGKVDGIALINGTNIKSEIGLRADRIVVYDASGNGTSPFFISGNQTYINTGIIENLSVGTIKLGANTLSVPQTFEFADALIDQTITQTISGGDSFTYVGQGNGDYIIFFNNQYYYIGMGSGDYIYNQPVYTFSGGITVFETGWIDLQSGGLPGNMMAVLYSTLWSYNTYDVGQKHLLWVDKNDGNGWQLSKQSTIGVVTSSGDTRGYIPTCMTTTVGNVIQCKFKLQAGRYNVAYGGTENSSYLQDITLAIMGTKR